MTRIWLTLAAILGILATIFIHREADSIVRGWD